MAHLVLVIDVEDSILQLNSKISADTTNPKAGINNLINYLSEISMGKKGDIQVTTRDTDPTVATSGTGSRQLNYTVT